jgi:hypothetical protein
MNSRKLNFLHKRGILYTIRELTNKNQDKHLVNILTNEIEW